MVRKLADLFGKWVPDAWGTCEILADGRSVRLWLPFIAEGRTNGVEQCKEHDSCGDRAVGAH